MNTSNYKAVMEELRTEYLEAFSEKFELWKKLFQEQDWYSLELEFHKMKGTGKTYGAPEVTDLCMHLERICREKKTIDQETLDQAISLLTSVADKYLKETPFDMEAQAAFQSIKSQ